MKISKNQLRQVIQEELAAVLQEQMAPVSFAGAGGYTYTQRDDGGFDFVGPSGARGTARPGSMAAKSIEAELETGTSLYKAPAQPSIPELDAVSDYIPELDMTSPQATGVPEFDQVSVPGAGDLANTGGDPVRQFIGRGRRKLARDAGYERSAVRGAAQAARKQAREFTKANRSGPFGNIGKPARSTRRGTRQTLTLPPRPVQEDLYEEIYEAVIRELGK